MPSSLYKNFFRKRKNEDAFVRRELESENAKQIAGERERERVIASACVVCVRLISIKTKLESKTSARIINLQKAAP